jgi:hypothetical protein
MNAPLKVVASARDRLKLEDYGIGVLEFARVPTNEKSTPVRLNSCEFSYGSETRSM